MRRLAVFYLVLDIPFLLLLYLGKIHALSPGMFFFGLGFFALIYHPMICGLRLISLGIIPWSKFLKTVLLFPGDRYFWEVFFSQKFAARIRAAQ